MLRSRISWQLSARAELDCLILEYEAMANRDSKHEQSRSRSPTRKQAVIKREPVEKKDSDDEDERIYEFADTHALSEEELSLLLHSNPHTVAKIMEYVNQHPEANNEWLDNQLHRLRVMFHCPSLTINGSSPGSIRPTSGASFRAQVPPTPTTSHLGATDQRTYKRYESCSASDRQAYWHGKCLKILRHYEHGLLLQIPELVEQLQPFSNRKL